MHKWPLFFLSLTLTVGCRSSVKDIPAEIVQVEPLIHVERLKPAINAAQLAINAFSNSPWELDDRGNWYLLDFSGHRVMKYGPDGQFICQIGSIGQDEQSLYYPLGICLDNDKLHVLNNDGANIRTYDVDGRFIRALNPPGVKIADAIAPLSGNLAVPARWNDPVEFNKRAALLILDGKGNEVRRIGQALRSNSFESYLTFNSLHLASWKNRVLGCFRMLPILFGYNIAGQQMFYRHLDERCRAPEVRELLRERRRMNIDEPLKKVTTESGLTVMPFFYGWGVDENGSMYGTINIREAKEGAIIVFDRSGNVSKRLLPQWQGRAVKLFRLLVKSSRQIYVLCPIDGEYHIAKIKKKEDKA